MGNLDFQQVDAHWSHEPTAGFLSPTGGEDQGAVSTSNDWTRIGTMNRERGALLHPDVETATRGAMLRAPTDRFMERD